MEPDILIFLSKLSLSETHALHGAETPTGKDSAVEFESGRVAELCKAGSIPLPAAKRIRTAGKCMRLNEICAVDHLFEYIILNRARRSSPVSVWSANFPFPPQ